MSLRKLRAGRVATANASTWVGEYGVIFYNEATGALRISDGETPGGNPLSLVASDFEFTFGDFIASTPEDGSATLSSANPNQDINIYSNGTGAVNMIGVFEVFPPNGSIYDRDPVFRIGNDGQMRIQSPLLDSNAGVVEIVGSTIGNSLTPGNSGAMLMVTGQLNTPCRIYFDGANEYSILVGRRYNGTLEDLTQVLEGEDIFRISATAATNTGMPNVGPCRIAFTALDNMTTAAYGGQIEFWATAKGQASSTRSRVAYIEPAGGVTATKFTGPLTGNVVSTNTGSVVLNTSAATAIFTGNVTGNVSGSAGSVAAANITGTTLASNVVTSSLTSVGTLTNLSVTNTITGSVSGSAGSVAAANITGTTLASNVVTSSLTSVGTLGSLSVTNNITCKGIINTPVNNGTQGTNFNIDLSAGNLQIVNITANNLVITLQNATAGKVTTLIIKSNGNYSITHGVSAANTSSNNTTVTVNNRSVTLIFSQFGTTIASDVYLGVS